MGLPSMYGRKENATRSASPTTDEGSEAKKPLTPQPPTEKQKAHNRIINKRHSFLMGMNVEILGDAILSKDVFEKLTDIMISLKETGTSALRIFHKFDGFDSGKISPSDFEAGMKKLDRHICTTISIADWGRLCERFQCDEEGESSVSSQKLADFCFEINDIGWKAEKTRLNHNTNVIKQRHQTKEEEENGEDPSLDAIIHDTGAVLEEEEGEGEDKPPAGPVTTAVTENSPDTDIHADEAKKAILVNDLTKLFWKTNDTVSLHFFLSDKVNLFTIVSYNTTKFCPFPDLHFDLEKLREVTKKKLVEKGEMLLEDYDKPLLHTKMSDFLMARFNIDSRGRLAVNRLSDDNQNLIETIQRKDVPETYKVGLDIERKKPVSMKDFRKTHVALQAEAAEGAKITKEAARKQKIVSISLEAFGGGNKKKWFDPAWSKAKQRWKRAMNSVLLNNTYSYYCDVVDGIDWNNFPKK